MQQSLVAFILWVLGASSLQGFSDAARVFDDYPIMDLAIEMKNRPPVPVAT